MNIERARSTLRALRHDPLLVDDRAVSDRLRATTLAPEVSRWARAWLVCWHAALVGDERYGRDDPWTIGLLLDDIALPKGGGDVNRRRVVLETLVDTGVATVDDTSGRRGTRVRIAESLFAEHAAAIAIDWDAVIARSGAEPAAILVMRALADLVVPTSAVAAVPRRDLIDRSGYQQKQVRVAIRRLVAADLLTADGDVGTTARYGFTPRALGRAWRESSSEPTSPALVERTPAPPLEVPAPVPAAGGVDLVIGGATLTIAAGATFEIAAGVAARVEVGPDGRPRLVIGLG